MKIVADENISNVKEFFAGFGDIQLMPGRVINTAAVAEADVLLVRSVTKVDKALLAGSRVKFVGTCTIGMDHIDQNYLRSQGIGFASAPGCNANAVVDYVLCALAALALAAALFVLARRDGVGFDAAALAGTLVRVTIATAVMTLAILVLHRADLGVSAFLVTALTVGAAVYGGVFWVIGRVG